MKYKISVYAKKHNVTYRTVWNWIKLGKLNFEQDSSGTIRIIEDENKALNVAIYARVSSSENKSNLDRQRERLAQYCAAKGYIISKSVSEIGSGLNDMRPKLEALLLDLSINLIVVEHKDRIARFGLNYIEKLLALQGRKIEIINVQNNDIDDLMQDFVSIITSFTARLYGKRRSKRATIKIINELNND